MDVWAFDVSKRELAFSCGSRQGKLDNRAPSIGSLLEGLPAGSTVAMEATGRYHRELAELACAKGFRVVVANPRRVKSFVRSTAHRGKTDRTDAMALARYVEAQGGALRAYAPAPELASRVRALARERRALSDARGSLGQSLALSEEARRAAEAGLGEAIAIVDRELAADLESVPEYRLMLQIPGVGPVVAAGLLGLLMSHDFASADSFVAYLGMDPRPNDSGSRQGRRYVSGQGDALGRRLAFLAGMAGMRTPAWKAYAQRHRDKALSGTEIALIVGRKIARTAWSLYTHKTPFDPERISRRLDKEP